MSSWRARVVGLLVAIALPFPGALRSGGAGTPSGNGDIDGSGRIDIADAVRLVSWLFLGSEAPVPIVCPSPGGGPLPSTGQTKCYNDGLALDAPCDSTRFPGQDGSFRASCPKEFRFTDHGDGTVTDRCTGLIWQQDTADVSGNGSIGDEDRLTWGEALRYCDRLEFAGRSDWRLPNVIELVSIIDYGRTGSEYPIVIHPRPVPDHAEIDPVFGAVSRAQYWTSTSNAREPDKAWWAFTGDGHSGSGATKTAHHFFVRAVRAQPDTSVFGADPAGPGIAPPGNGDINGSGRIDISDPVQLLGWLFLGSEAPVAIVCPPRGGGPLPGTGQADCYDEAGGKVPCSSAEFPGQDGAFAALSLPGELRFIDHGDGTVTDRSTGLTWQKGTADVSGNGSIGDEDRLTWGEALRYCDRLEFAGRSDWRLPNVKELFSIVDHGRFDLAIHPVFSSVSRSHWTSTTHLRTPDDAWLIPFHDGVITDSQKTLSPVDDNIYFVRAVRGGL